jgi:hypothetical protein
MVVSYISDAQWLGWSLAVLTRPVNTLSSLLTPLTLSSTITNSPVAGLLHRPARIHRAPRAAPIDWRSLYLLRHLVADFNPKRIEGDI